MKRLILSFTAIMTVCNFAQAQNRIGTGSVDDLYQTHCAACHGENLTGGQGSSLVDGVWKYGGTDAEITKSIRI